VVVEAFRKTHSTKERKVRTKFAIGLAEAEVAAKAACEEARAEGWAVTVAVVDDAGLLVHLSRMDDASAGSVFGAIEKGRSSAPMGIETKVLEDLVAKRPGLATIGRVALEGGVPIRHQQQRIGGIGVSGLQSHQDAQVANAGLKVSSAVIMRQTG
jgi:glc operon protein GlcG